MCYLDTFTVICHKLTYCGIQCYLLTKACNHQIRIWGTEENPGISNYFRSHDLIFTCAGSAGVSLVAVQWLLIVVASLLAAPRLWGTGAVAVVHGLSCPVACGIFLDQESNSCLLHWQADFFFYHWATRKVLKLLFCVNKICKILLCETNFLTQTLFCLMYVCMHTRLCICTEREYMCGVCMSPHIQK